MRFVRLGGHAEFRRSCFFIIIRDDAVVIAVIKLCFIIKKNTILYPIFLLHIISTRRFLDAAHISFHGAECSK